MKLKAQKNILLLAGIIATVVGIVVSIPALLKENYIAATVSTLLIILGLVLVSLGFGED